MNKGLKRAAARGAVAVALAAGAIAGTVGTASAAPLHDHHGPKQQHCKVVAGHWERVWHPVYQDRNHHEHTGYWTRVWQPAHREYRR
ncbi:hypothetical protein [Actinacidiphila rubida]|uniref:Uncharacterized protein n=1 Tax=Actinacidiphila rubida TaxID=310780 RepID=A0A1H8EAH0_9ACTN|nr:hypothetical protein [Actinacidiphila rubida]SEN16390.1 hypothetical protein SAMN05216267_100299 [Actinacidiphila rubida]